MASQYTDNQKRELILRAVREKAIPPILYKYRAFNDWTESLFKKHQLWFSSPKEFNDPFDCRIHNDGSHSSADVTKYLGKSGVTPIDASSVILANAAKGGTLITETIEDSKQRTLDSRGLLCLSKRSDSILMWSHYSQSHTGFVMGFAVEKDPLFFWNPLVVKYSRKYPSFSYIKEQEQIITRGVGTKAFDWRYEKEVRVIKDRPGPYVFKEECLVEVLLGCRSSQDDRIRMTKLLSTTVYREVELKQAKVSGTTFSIESYSHALTSKPKRRR